MKFGIYFVKHLIPEWQNCYVNYNLLKKIISQLSAYEDKFVLTFGNIKVSNLDDSESAEIQSIIETFEKLLILQFKHFNYCFRYHLQYTAKQKLIKIFWNFAAIESDPKRKKDPKLKERMTSVVEKYYKEIITLRNFVNLNFRCIYKILKKFKKLSSKVHKFDEEFTILFNKKIIKSYVYRNSLTLLKIIKITENTYLEKCGGDKDINSANARLNKIAQNKALTYGEVYKTGLFTGMIVISVIIIIFLIIQTGFFTLDSTDNFLKYQFNIFRGSLILILYVFFWGVNVFIFEKYNINFTRVLNIQLHHSTPFEIWNRSFLFLMIWILSILYCSITNYMFNNSLTQVNYDGGPLQYFFNSYASTFVAILPYLFFILYLIFPSRTIFNGRGRMWFFRLCWDIIRSPFYNFPFIVPWATDQLLTLTIAFRDLWYTVCYFINACGDASMVNPCRENNIHAIEYIVLFIPLAYRIMQCLNRVYYNKSRKDKIIQALNTLKYTSSVISTIFSFYNKGNVMFILWIVAVVISSLYSFFWDLKYDWCFLQKGSKHFLLRNQLSYPHKSFYYGIIAANFIMRFTWTLSINSLSVLQSPVARNVVALVVGAIETFRRSCWNYFRVEVEHLKTVGKFSIFQEFNLPLDFQLDMKDPVMKKLAHDEFNRILNSVDYSSKREFVIDRDFDITNYEEHADEYLKQNKLSISPNASFNSVYEEPAEMENENQKYLKELEETKAMVVRPKKSKSITTLKLQVPSRNSSENEEDTTPKKASPRSKKESEVRDVKDRTQSVPLMSFPDTMTKLEDRENENNSDDSRSIDEDMDPQKRSFIENSGSISRGKDPQIGSTSLINQDDSSQKIKPRSRQETLSNIINDLPLIVLKKIKSDSKTKSFAQVPLPTISEIKLDNHDNYKEDLPKPQQIQLKEIPTLKPALKHAQKNTGRPVVMGSKPTVHFKDQKSMTSDSETD